MKKIIPGSLLFLLFAGGCTKTDFSETKPAENAALLEITDRTCVSHDLLAAQLAADPDLRARREALEAFTRKAIASGDINKMTW